MTKIGKKCFDKNYQHEKNKGENKRSSSTATT